jgi:hypothetical protein
MFVVIALIADVETPGSSRSVAAFGTPTIVHFCVALVIGATLSAPWGSLKSAGIALGGLGAAGLGYSFIVVRRARRQTDYQPVLEDWLWHTVFPIAAYSTIVIAAIKVAGDPARPLFAIAAATLSLVLIGIHNAWDTVTYIALQQREGQGTRGQSGPIPSAGEARTPQK